MINRGSYNNVAMRLLLLFVESKFVSSCKCIFLSFIFLARARSKTSNFISQSCKYGQNEIMFSILHFQMVLLLVQVGYKDRSFHRWRMLPSMVFLLLLLQFICVLWNIANCNLLVSLHN